MVRASATTGGHGGREPRGELGQASRRDGDVELHRDALGVDRLGVLLAVGPQRALARRVGGDVGVEQALGLADRLDEVVGRVGGVGALEQQVGGVVLGERRRQGPVLADEGEPLGEQQLRGGEVRQPCTQPGQDGDRAVRVGQGEQGDAPRGQARHQPQPGARDDAERAPRCRRAATRGRSRCRP
jgi:hypothetical protein